MGRALATGAAMGYRSVCTADWQTHPRPRKRPPGILISLQVARDCPVAYVELADCFKIIKQKRPEETAASCGSGNKLETPVKISGPEVHLMAQDGLTRMLLMRRDWDRVKDAGGSGFFGGLVLSFSLSSIPSTPLPSFLRFSLHSFIPSSLPLFSLFSILEILPLSSLFLFFLLPFSFPLSPSSIPKILPLSYLSLFLLLPFPSPFLNLLYPQNSSPFFDFPILSPPLLPLLSLKFFPFLSFSLFLLLLPFLLPLFPYPSFYLFLFLYNPRPSSLPYTIPLISPSFSYSFFITHLPLPFLFPVLSLSPFSLSPPVSYSPLFSFLSFSSCFALFPLLLSPFLLSLPLFLSFLFLFIVSSPLPFLHPSSSSLSPSFPILLFSSYSPLWASQSPLPPTPSQLPTHPPTPLPFPPTPVTHPLSLSPQPPTPLPPPTLSPNTQYSHQLPDLSLPQPPTPTPLPSHSPLPQHAVLPTCFLIPPSLLPSHSPLPAQHAVLPTSFLIPPSPPNPPHPHSLPTPPPPTRSTPHLLPDNNDAT
ncbi:hypothetical protein C7M84_003235 [Penaeus vannamei]|uniref:Uncharacterized protein n=1 Tax=Penaeus vannamei TaxID=6689 RepID=A0A3R7QGE4_PENVA|nr:hypothetical protein C7M84_003235 [Penaeus vannamei]